MKKLLIIIPAVLICFGLIWFLFLRESPSDTIPDSGFEEEYEESKEDKDYDLTDKFSETQKAEMKNEAKDLIKQYLSAYYNFNYKKTEKNNYLEELNHCSLPNYPEKDELFDNLVSENIVSKYIDFEDISFTVLNDTPEVQLLVLTHTDMESISFPKGEYSILGRLTLTKDHNEWFIRAYHPSSVYKYGTTKVSESEYEDYIHLDGAYVGEFQVEGIEDNNSSKENRTAVGDGYMEDTQNGTYEAFEEDTGDSIEASEEYYDTLEDAIANDFQESTPGAHD